MQLAIGARIDGATANSGAHGDVAAGVELRAAMGARWFGGAVGIGALAPTTGVFETVTVRQQRFPASLALVMRHRLSPSFELGAELGLALALLTIRGENLAGGSRATRLDTGARLAVEARGPRFARGLVPFAALHAEIFPRPYVLDVDPLGQVGETHHLWIGAAAGVSLDRP